MRRISKRQRAYTAIGVVALLLTLIVAVTQAQSSDSFESRLGAIGAEADATIAALETRVADLEGAQAPTATSSPEPTATATTEPAPTATATHDHDEGEAGVCGESNLTWHAPVVNGCATGHEHGDAPPQWVLDAGYTPEFTHVAGTPNENAFPHKHSAFKGFILVDDGVTLYTIMHLDTNPGGHANRFHSFQSWARDPSGGVSHWSGWLDFGVANDTGPQIRREGCESIGVRPIMDVNDQGCGSVTFEAWYSRAGNNVGWDFGFNVSPTYYAGGDPADPTTWDTTGGLNLTRRIEAAWYAFRSPERGSFWTDQFGFRVSGPESAICGATITVGERTYTRVCLEQFVAPTMVSMQFPGNSVQKVYPGQGVVLPN